MVSWAHLKQRRSRINEFTMKTPLLREVISKFITRQRVTETKAPRGTSVLHPGQNAGRKRRGVGSTPRTGALPAPLLASHHPSARLAGRGIVGAVWFRAGQSRGSNAHRRLDRDTGTAAGHGCRGRRASPGGASHTQAGTLRLHPCVLSDLHPHSVSWLFVCFSYFLELC